MKKAKAFCSLLYVFALASCCTLSVAAEEMEDVSMMNSEDTEAIKGVRIAVVTKNVSGRFWSSVKKGMEQAVIDINKQYGLKKGDQIQMTYEGPKNEEKISDQINTIDAVLAENPDILCLAAADMSSCEAQLEMAWENGIPVIMFDSDVTTELSASFLGTDNTKAGEIAAEKMAEAMNEQGNIVVFAHQEKTKTSSERVHGFLEKAESYENMKVTEVFYHDQEDSLRQTILNYLKEHEEVTGIFCTNEDVSAIFLKTLRELSGKQYTVVTVDMSAGEENAIKNGTVLGAVMQQPYQMGYDTIQRAVDLLLEKEIEKKTLYDPYWADAEFIDANVVK